MQTHPPYPYPPAHPHPFTQPTATTLSLHSPLPSPTSTDLSTHPAPHPRIPTTRSQRDAILHNIVPPEVAAVLVQNAARQQARRNGALATDPAPPTRTPRKSAAGAGMAATASTSAAHLGQRSRGALGRLSGSQASHRRRSSHTAPLESTSEIRHARRSLGGQQCGAGDAGIASGESGGLRPTMAVDEASGTEAARKSMQVRVVVMVRWGARDEQGNVCEGGGGGEVGASTEQVDAGAGGGGDGGWRQGMSRALQVRLVGLGAAGHCEITTLISRNVSMVVRRERGLGAGGRASAPPRFRSHALRFAFSLIFSAGIEAPTSPAAHRHPGRLERRLQKRHGVQVRRGIQTR